jgi:beta-glucosidase
MADLGVADVVPPGLPRSAIGRPIEPAGLSEALTQITARYGRIPLYITENGICLNDYVNPDKHVNDDPRIEFLENHIAAAAKAIESGVDLRGYFVWSLLDNLEWHLGYAPRFGLVYVDFATQTRYPKKSYAWFREYLGDAKEPSD